jgi:hypothetical protein
MDPYGSGSATMTKSGNILEKTEERGKKTRHLWKVDKNYVDSSLSGQNTSKPQLITYVTNEFNYYHHFTVASDLPWLKKLTNEEFAIVKADES